MDSIIGMGLAAGRGERFRPLSLKAPGYLRAKAAVTLLGRSVMDWIVDLLLLQGINDYVMVTKGKENRYQIKSIVGYGETHGVRVRYSPVRYDRDNTGSADAALTNFAYFDLSGTALVFPTDTVFDIDVKDMLRTHRKSGAVVTIAAAAYPAETIAGRYGLIQCDKDGRVRGFVEKPSLQRIDELYGVTPETRAQLPPLTTNAGFYLMETGRLREICDHSELVAQRAHSLDIGGDLLPWLVARGHTVMAHTIGRMGDLGNIPSYLETMRDVLHGRFASLHPFLHGKFDSPEGVMIAPETLAERDPKSGLTVAEMIAAGMITIHAPVHVGKYVRLARGVTLDECNIDDDCEIGAGAVIRRASIGTGSYLGPGAHVEEALVGCMTELRSTPKHPVRMRRGSAIGDEVILREGVTLNQGSLIHPHLKVPSGLQVPANLEIDGVPALMGLM